MGWSGNNSLLGTSCIHGTHVYKALLIDSGDSVLADKHRFCPHGACSLTRKTKDPSKQEGWYDEESQCLLWSWHDSGHTHSYIYSQLNLILSLRLAKPCYPFFIFASVLPGICELISKCAYTYKLEKTRIPAKTTLSNILRARDLVRQWWLSGCSGGISNFPVSVWEKDYHSHCSAPAPLIKALCFPSWYQISRNRPYTYTPRYPRIASPVWVIQAPPFVSICMSPSRGQDCTMHPSSCPVSNKPEKTAWFTASGQIKAQNKWLPVCLEMTAWETVCAGSQ